MSFRDLRNYGEMMRALGCDMKISIDSFRNPNFPLVAESLKWMVKQYDASIPVFADIDTEDERVTFITTTCAIVASKMNVRMNPRRLYAADGAAVKELLKLCTLLYQAQEAAMEAMKTCADLANTEGPIQVDLAALQSGRSLCAELPADAVKLFDLLKDEQGLRVERQQAVSASLDLTAMEQALNGATQAVREELQMVVSSLDSTARDREEMEQRMSSKKNDLQRKKKRLDNLATVRPSFMDEYERYESNLNKLYELYAQKSRNLTWLEHRLDEQNRLHEDKRRSIREALQSLQQYIQDDEDATLRRAADEDELYLDDEDPYGMGDDGAFGADDDLLEEESFGGAVNRKGAGRKAIRLGGDSDDGSEVDMDEDEIDALLGGDDEEDEDDDDLDDVGLNSDDDGLIDSDDDEEDEDAVTLESNAHTRARPQLRPTNGNRRARSGRRPDFTRSSSSETFSVQHAPSSDMMDGAIPEEDEDEDDFGF